MGRVSITSVLCLAWAAGCGPAPPYKVTTTGLYGGERTIYTHEVRAGFTGRSAVDEVTGHTVTFGDARVEHMEPAAFKAAVALERAKEAEREAASRKADEFRRREEADRLRIENQVWQKDYERWYARFLGSGYTDEEARFKATEMMRGF